MIDPAGADDRRGGSGVRPGYDPSVRRYVWFVALAGLTLLALLTPGSDVVDLASTGAGFWVFSLFVVVSELFPIAVQRRDEVDEITTSTTFAFALLLAYGAGPAVASLAVASLVGDLAQRKPLWKVLFNVGQYTISLGAAAAVYELLTPSHELHADGLPAVLVAAAVFFLLNTLITSVALGMAQGVPLAGYVARDFVFQGHTAPALLALSPIVVLAAERSLWYVPLLAIPIAAVYWGTTVALENVRLVQRLQASLEHLTELNRLKDDFVAVVSHELRTPLTSIQGYIKTMLQLPGELDADQRVSFLEAADRQSDRLRGLVEQLLVVVRLESHVEPLQVSPVALPSLAAAVVDELRARAHGHTFDLRFAPDLPDVRTDEDKVHHILSNLVENALKYSLPDTRVTIRGEVGVSGVLVAVEDEGPGIPSDEREQVFERFYQVDSSVTRAVGGAGLGLYICRKMADTIGARLWLDRSEPGGSVFCLFVPSAPPKEEKPIREDAPARPEDPPSQSMTASV